MNRYGLSSLLLFWREYFATALVWVGTVLTVLPLLVLGIITARRSTQLAIPFPPLHLPGHITISLLLAILAGLSLFGCGVSLHHHLQHPPATRAEAQRRLLKGTLWGGLCGLTISLTLHVTRIGTEMLLLYSVVAGGVLGMVAFARPGDLHTGD